MKNIQDMSISSDNIIIHQVHSAPIHPEACSVRYWELFSMAHEIAEGLIDDFSHETYPSKQEVDPWSEILQKILSDIACELRKGDGEKPVPRAEDTVAAILHKGVAASAVRVSFKHITLTLANGVYRIYREMSGFPAGSLRILKPGCTWTVMLALTSDALAEFILYLDGGIPEIRPIADHVSEAVAAERRRREAEKKADEIGMTAVRRLLEGLPVLKVGCEYDIRDGNVCLELTRTLTASLVIPLEEFPDFISDPERILSILSPAETPPPYPMRHMSFS